jgi:hypothetical protein
MITAAMDYEQKHIAHIELLKNFFGLAIPAIRIRVISPNMN